MNTLIREDGLAIVTRERSSYDLRSAFAAQSVRAADRGTNTEGNVITQTVDGRDLNEIWSEMQSALNAWNAGRSALVSALTFNVQNPIEDVAQAAIEDFEEASEFGEPRGIGGGTWFSMGYDFKWFDVAVRYTWKFLAEATSGQVTQLHNQVLEADNRLVFNKILKSIFNNVNRTTNIRGNNYNVYAFYNNDGTTPPSFKNYTFTSTHDHYLVSGGSAIDSGDLDTIDLHLSHHGYGAAEGSTMIVLVNRQELNVIRSLRVASGASYDFIAGNGQPPWLLPTNTGGVVFPQGESIPPTVNGLNVVGRYGPLLIVQEDYIPAGYVLAFSTGGDNQASNPVGIREHQNAALRGLRLVKGAQPDYPLVDSFYNRGFGTGIRHRGAGLVMQIKASGTYDIPSAYA